MDAPSQLPSLLPPPKGNQQKEKRKRGEKGWGEGEGKGRKGGEDQRREGPFARLDS